MRKAPFTASLLLLLLAPPALALRVGGSTLMGPVAEDAGALMRAEKETKVAVEGGGSEAGLAGVANGSFDVGMSTHPLTEEDRLRHPGVSLYAVPIGVDALALAVSRDVSKGGVTALTRDQLRGIHEGRIVRWKDVGGPDEPVLFLAPGPGPDSDFLLTWLYGSPREAPTTSHPAVAGPEERRAKAAAGKGAVTLLPLGMLGGDDGLVPLALGSAGGATVAPEPATLATRRYPLARTLLLVTNGPPAGDAAAFVELLLSPRGQALVGKRGFLTLEKGMPKGGAPAE